MGCFFIGGARFLVFDGGFWGQLAQTNATKHKTTNNPMILQSKSIEHSQSPTRFGRVLLAIIPSRCMPNMSRMCKFGGEP